MDEEEPTGRAHAASEEIELCPSCGSPYEKDDGRLSPTGVVVCFRCSVILDPKG